MISNDISDIILLIAIGWALAVIVVKMWSLLTGRWLKGGFGITREMLGLIAAIWAGLGWLLGYLDLTSVNPERVILMVPPMVILLSLTITRTLTEAAHECH